MAKNRHIPHATAGRKSHSLRAVVLTAALLACVTAAVQPAQAQSPSATYEVVDGTAREPAVARGLSDEGQFTITLNNLNDDQERAGNVAFFFRLTSGLPNPGPDRTPGYGTPDPIMVTNTTSLATRQQAGNDFKFILAYRSVTDGFITREFKNLPNVGYTNDEDRALKAVNNKYTFRVVPLHDNRDDEGMEFLLFGFRVFFSGTNNSSDLTGRVNGGDGDTAITIAEPPPTAEYTLRDDDASEPATADGIANEGQFTITLARLDNFQSETTRDLVFFFRFMPTPEDPAPGQTNGYDPLDLSLFSNIILRAEKDDIEFILEYKDVTSTPVVITDFSTDSDGNYSNDATAPRAMDDVYTFRVVPLHDEDDGDASQSLRRGERLVFGYQVQFAGDTNNEHNLHGKVNGVEHRAPVVITEPPPATAVYTLNDGTATEPAIEGGIADEGEFTITLSHLNSDQVAADVAFFFRFAPTPDSSPGQTNGFGTLDPSLSSTEHATISGDEADFEFILEYTDVGDNFVVITDFRTDGDGNYNNDAMPASRAADNVYTFRVVPLHDNRDDEGVELLLFGYRVQFNGIDNSNDLQGRVNGGTPDTPVVIGEPPPTATYEVVDPTAREPTTQSELAADEGEFTITLSHLNEFQRNSTRGLTFFFRLTSGPLISASVPGGTPGYGTLDPSVMNPGNLATRNDAGLDFEFILEYTEDGATVTQEFDNETVVYSNRSNPVRATPNDDGTEVYTFRVVPLHDDDDSMGGESLLFGYRVSFNEVRRPPRNELKGQVNGGDGDTAIIIDDPLPVALYDRTDGDAREPAIEGGFADEGEFTITLDHLNSDQEAANSVAFFFRFATAPTSPSPGQTNGFGTLDPNLSSTKHATISGGDDDFEFILDYRDVNDNPVEITDFSADSDGNYNNNASPAPRAMDDVYTFRVVPKHDNDNDNGPDGEILVFGYRVQFNGIDNSNDLHGRVNGTPDTLVVIDEPIPTASYAVIDGTAHEPAEPAAEGGIADEGEFTITLSRLNEFQRNSTRGLTFFFRLTSGPPISTSGPDETPGHGTPDPSVMNPDNLATRNSAGLDFEFILEYTEDGATVTQEFDNETVVYSNRSNPVRATPNDDGTEVYTFRVVPLHDDDDSMGGESLLFGYRVSFNEVSNPKNELKGQVNGGDGDPAITIDDPNTGIRLRIRTFLEGALQ